MYSIVLSKCFENWSDNVKKAVVWKLLLSKMQNSVAFKTEMEKLIFKLARADVVSSPSKTMLSKIIYTKLSTFVTNTQTFY